VSDFLRLLEHARPYRGRLGAAFAAMAVYAASQSAFLYIVEKIIDKVLTTGGGLNWVITSILILSVVRGLSGYAYAYLMTDRPARRPRSRERFFGHVLRQSATFFSRRSSGQLLSRLTNDVAQIQRAVSETTGDLIRESMILIGYIGYMFYLQWELAMVCTVTAPLIVYPLSQLGRRVRGQTKRSQEELEHLTHIASEAFSGHRIVKAFGAESRETARFQRASDRLYQTYMRVTH
jgi:subfamily B ATP-binding cassette protein MsbA